MNFRLLVREKAKIHRSHKRVFNGLVVDIYTMWFNSIVPPLHGFCVCMDVSMTSNLKFTVQGFAESLQQDSSNQSEIVMIKLYCCGPGYCSRYPLLHYFFQIRNGLGSSVFKLCCKDSAKPCMCRLVVFCKLQM